MMDYGQLSAEARELVLFAENDEPTYRHEQAIVANLDRKMKKGIFDREKAKKLFRYEADGAAKRYAKEFGGGAWHKIFSTSARDEAAGFMRDAYEREARHRLTEHAKTR